MLSDPLVMKAVTSLTQRSERRQDEQKIMETFVDSGILAQMTNNNDQILYGRRGTGKTHVFQVLAREFLKNRNNAVIFIDGRTLGSTAQFCDSTISLPQRCTSLFRDILCEVHNGLLEHIVHEPSEKADEAFNSLVRLNNIAVEPVRKPTGEIVSDKEKGISKHRGEIGASAGIKHGPVIHAKLGNSSVSETEQEVTYEIALEDKIIFPAIHSTLNEVLKQGDVDLIILFDEWSSLPLDVQPYLAEFLKRTFLPSSSVVLKIASLEYRSRFGISKEGGFTGFEMGSDISANLDLDDYYVFDRNPERVTTIMANILFKHIASELPEMYLETNYGVDSGDKLASRMFTQRTTFQELTRASEGVARDLINIFITAYFDSQRKGRDKIEQKSVIEAARQWFETDKEQNLDENLRKILSRIVDDVIGQRRARSFLIERDLEKHSVIQRLFDSRVLHLVQRGYADKDNPGRRYNIYTLDYGTYVDLMNTSRQPQIEMFLLTDEEDAHDRVVPFDDKRSIRRIILTRDVLENK